MAHDANAHLDTAPAPGGELGGTWASPTVDATHSGSAHHTEDHDHDGTPTQKLLAANSHESPSADTHHAKNHGAVEHTGIGGGLSVVATEDTSESLGVGFVDATGLSFAVAASKTYHFEWYVLFTSAATTTGLYLAMNGPASPTAIAYEVKYPFATTTTSARNATAYETGTAATGSLTANTPLFAQMAGIFVNGSNAGTLQVRFQTEIPTSAVVIKAGSGGRLYLMN